MEIEATLRIPGEVPFVASATGERDGVVVVWGGEEEDVLYVDGRLLGRVLNVVRHGEPVYEFTKGPPRAWVTHATVIECVLVV